MAAEVSGVNTTATLIRIYITAGIMYAVAGWLLAAAVAFGAGAIPAAAAGSRSETAEAVEAEEVAVVPIPPAVLRWWMLMIHIQQVLLKKWVR